ncbi:hypothetical protein HYU50_01940 [Candidatus Woesearchaeota archaeon]|nr:hypothetical protein [Candidatus Woesearchaeota archaeon]
MGSKHIVISSLKESFLLIKKNKKVFLLVFILQVLFFLLIVMVNVYHMPQILQSAKDAIDYAEALNINPQTANIDMLQKKNPLGEDPLLISRNYDLIIKNSFYLLFSIFLIFVVINGLIWYFSSNINEKGKNLFSLKNILRYLSRFFIIAIILSVPLYFFAYALVKTSFSSFLSAKPADFVPLLLIAAIAIYFIYISIPILDKIKFKSLAKKLFSIGTKNFIPVIISYLIILILIMASLFLIFYLIELNLFLLLIAVLLSIFVFAWAKIYFSVVVKKLSGL